MILINCCSYKVFAYLSVFLLLAGCVGNLSHDSAVVKQLRPKIRELGGRNWIVIAESAFPIRNNAGLEVIAVDADIPYLVETVGQLIEETYHVRPRVYETTEINHVDYDYAPGIKNYMEQLELALHGRPVITLDHEMLLQLMDNTSEKYRVLVIKSNTALPYSSVFMELGSGYWDTDSESKLRETIEQKLKNPNN